MNHASLDDPNQIPFIDLDANDFAELLFGMEQTLLARIYHWVGNHHDAEDIFQETAVRGWLYRLSLMDKESFPGWICQIAVNTMKRFGARKSQEKRTLEQYVQKQQHNFKEQGLRIRPEVDPSSVCLVNELKEMMELLPEECRELCHLFSFEGLLPGELAKQFSISENTIRYRLKKSGLLLNSMYGNGLFE